MPFGPVDKPAPALSYLEVGFLNHFILRGLGQGFGWLLFSAILLSEGHGSITLAFARQVARQCAVSPSMVDCLRVALPKIGSEDRTPYTDRHGNVSTMKHGRAFPARLGESRSPRDKRA